MNEMTNNAVEKITSTVDKINSETLARGLGWFSVGLGLMELCGPQTLCRWIGIRPHNSHMRLLRACGARELGNGLALLFRRRSASWAWTRVAGDAIDLALLGAAFKLADAQAGRLAAATTAVAGVTALDVLCGRQLSQTAESIVEKANAQMRSAM